MLLSEWRAGSGWWVMTPQRFVSSNVSPTGSVLTILCELLSSATHLDGRVLYNFKRTRSLEVSSYGVFICSMATRMNGGMVVLSAASVSLRQHVRLCKEIRPLDTFPMLMEHQATNTKNHNNKHTHKHAHKHKR